MEVNISPTTILVSAPSPFNFSQTQINIKRVYPRWIVLIAVLIVDNSLADAKSEYNFGFALCSEFCFLHIISKMSISIFSLIAEMMSISVKQGYISSMSRFANNSKFQIL
ncbi:hypothetical protein CEN46_16885 [Fischerella thermalis CCMEE 5318]|uniref:Uncharacterized protein n=1 Tax=Fischerella thermalis CCMEE 5318 TaxID=2019666 RepID=A0A2N6LBV2_9CYAN|nr:hypothetical protein CEN46_16885 [Fischerella thermalis CCMEE 5318]